MKKKKENKILKFVFGLFFLGFVIVYFSELTGYYEYQNYKKSALTTQQIQNFEKDIETGKEIDINKYLVAENKDYNNNLSKITSKLSDGISNIVKNGVERAFKFLSTLVE